MKKRFAMRLAPTVCLAWISQALPAALSVQDFLGPPVGKTYTYRIANGETMDVIGLAPTAKKGVKVEERVRIPSDLALPRNAQIRPTRYELVNVQGTLVRIYDRFAEVMLQEPLTPQARSWTRTAVTYDTRGSAAKLELACAITALGSENTFKANRSIISVHCETRDEKLSVLLDEKYAEGIGLEERSIEMFNESHESFGKQRLILEKIESNSP